MKKVLCIGCVTTDIIVSPVADVPAPGTLRAVDSVSMHVGGCASNAAIDLAKLGIPAALCCRLGRDSFGSFVYETAKNAGVDVSGITFGEDFQTTASVVCVVPGGERSFLYQPGSTAALKSEHVNDTLVQNSDLIFVAGAMLLSEFDGLPCAELLKKAQQMGKYTLMDTAWDFSNRWLPSIEAAIPYLDVFMPSYDEAVKLSRETDPEKIALFFAAMGAKNVIIKLGKDGAYFLENEKPGYYFPGYPCENPADTTGAGDSFCAGFLAGLAKGLSFAECGKIACATGRYCVTQIGASAGIPPLEVVLEYIRKQENA